MFRQAIASLLILIILAVVVSFGVSGLMHILLVLTAGVLSILLVRRPRVAGPERPADE